MLHECAHCYKKAETLKRCANCSIVWYCNSQCQRSNWPVHLIYCELGRPVTTAERLVAFVHERSIPDLETRCDYGFIYTPSHEEGLMRLSVYTILILELQVKAKTIHRWMVQGDLDARMRETFDSHLTPEQRLQPPYLWFCSHQSTFNRVPGFIPYDVDITNTFRKAWLFIGGSPSISGLALMTHLRSFTIDQLTCYIFLAFLIDHRKPTPPAHPSLRLPSDWVEFGFCACTSLVEENTLADKYCTLLQRVSFDAFCQAYSSSSLSKLFANNGLTIGERLILDVLNSRTHKSVWHLKRYLCSSSVEDPLQDTPNDPYVKDYGFSNCRNGGEVVALRDVYRRVLLSTNADPLGLHAACVRGQLFEYVGKVIRLKSPQMFKRLMRNPYPSRREIANGPA